MKQGIYFDQSNEAYHADSEAYSSSDIITMGKGGFDYWLWKKKQVRKYSADYTIGSVTHLMLEARIKRAPHLIAEQVAIYTGKGKYDSAGFKEFVAANPGQYCLLEGDLEYCQSMIEAVFAEPEAVKWFDGCVSEPSIYTNYPGTRVPMKCRPDLLNIEKGYSVNFKTMRDASESGWIKAVGEHAYDWQSGTYVDLLRGYFGYSFDEVHVCVEKPSEEGAPIRVEVYAIPDSAIEFARSQYQQIIAKIPECELKNEWPKPKAYLKAPEIPMWRQMVVEV